MHVHLSVTSSPCTHGCTQGCGKATVDATTAVREAYLSGYNQGKEDQDNLDPERKQFESVAKACSEQQVPFRKWLKTVLPEEGK